MRDRRIEQALVVNARCTARSPGFTDVQAESVEQFARTFGTLSTNAAALLVTPLPSAVGVMQVLGDRIYVLAVPLKLYRAAADPFHLARTFPADFAVHDLLPALHWDVAPPPRTLKQVQQVLRSGDGPALLGTAQALVDGGRVALPRPSPDPRTLESIWTLLPDANRAELTMATFAPTNRPGFDLVVAPRVDGPNFAGYLPEEHAGDYPEGRYELAVQLAVETDDADGLDRLFARRSMSQSVRLALTLLIGSILGGLAVRFIPWHKLG